MNRAWLARKTEKVVAGKAVLVVPSGESHFAVTDENMAACELEAKRDTIMRRGTLFGSLAKGTSGNQSAGETSTG